MKHIIFIITIVLMNSPIILASGKKTLNPPAQCPANHKKQADVKEGCELSKKARLPVFQKGDVVHVDCKFIGTAGTVECSYSELTSKLSLWQLTSVIDRYNETIVGRKRKTDELLSEYIPLIKNSPDAVEESSIYLISGGPLDWNDPMSMVLDINLIQAAWVTKVKRKGSDKLETIK